MAADEAHTDTAARDYWDDPGKLPYAREAVGKTRQENPAHTWYRLPSVDSFTAGCSCGWVSPERKTFDEMTHDVDQHLDAMRQAEAPQA